MTSAPIALMVVDDHQVVRLGLASLFDTVPHCSVVAQAATAEEAITEARRTKPHVILMDVRLPDTNGIEACRTIRDELPETRVIMLTSYTDEEAVVASVMAGASGYLLKNTDGNELIEAVEKVARGGSLLDPTVTDIVMGWMRRQNAPKLPEPLARLSEQERNILPLIAEGKTNRQIAATLFLSEHTVKTYVSNILQKLQLARRAEAAAFITRQRQGNGA